MVNKDELCCFQGNESTMFKRTGFNLWYFILPWATHSCYVVEHTVLYIPFIYIKDTVWDHKMHYR